MLEDEVLSINQKKGQELWYASEYIEWGYTGTAGDYS